MMTDDSDVLNYTMNFLGSYVARNHVPVSQLSELFTTTYASIRGLGAPPAPLPEVRKPAVPVKESVFHDRIVCLDCGKGFQSLKRHIGTAHGQTAAEYRAEWGLGADYPLVAPDYAAKRSQLAKAAGLGRKPAGAAR